MTKELQSVKSLILAEDYDLAIITMKSLGYSGKQIKKFIKNILYGKKPKYRKMSPRWYVSGKDAYAYTWNRNTTKIEWEFPSYDVMLEKSEHYRDGIRIGVGFILSIINCNTFSPYIHPYKTYRISYGAYSGAIHSPEDKMKRIKKIFNVITHHINLGVNELYKDVWK